jgi:hypothetical protein
MAQLDGQLRDQEREEKGSDGRETRGSHDRNGRHGHSAIAARLSLSPKTLEAHIRRILQRLSLEESPTITGACWPSWNTCVRRADPAAGLRIAWTAHDDECCLAIGH